MPHPVAVLNVVGLSDSLLPHAPRLRALATPRLLRPVLPAVTASVQASMLTGLPVAGHGIVGNGWYFRDLAEVRFWNRSGRLVGGTPVWETARRRAAAVSPVTVANLFWWHNAYIGCDVMMQARPIYKADGRKLPDCVTHPPELRDDLQSPPPRGLGPFPLFHFWGPLADLRSSQWIADAARHVAERYDPTLLLVYLPHLDYGLQKLGPEDPQIARHVADIDRVAGELAAFLQQRGRRIIVVSEYGIEPTLPRHAAIAVNRALRVAGLLDVRVEDGLETLDPGACEAFAVADHQVAHVYVREPRRVEAARRVCERIAGVDQITTIDHPRAGELVLVAQPGCWFTYDWWLSDEQAPDFARTVDIHRKPGYDPRELFSAASPAAVAWKLARRKLGLRQLLDIVPLEPSLVRGTHGRTDMPPQRAPLLLADPAWQPEGDQPLPCEAVHDVILQALLAD